MQRVVLEEPYTFIPPRFSRFWYQVTKVILPGKLKKEYGISAAECVGAEKLRASLDSGHGVMLVPNHCRPCDPLTIDALAREVGRPFTGIASWHVFMSSRFQKFLLPRLGGFSVYREATDRESLKCGINMLVEGKHPLVVFAEGIVTRTNDLLRNFMEGPSFMARAAAKKRSDGKVIIHPVFMRYFFEGDLEQSVTPVLEEIEKRLSWQPQTDLPLRERVIKTGDALLAIKELEYLKSPQNGSYTERLNRLIEFLLTRLEKQWLSSPPEGDPIQRAKHLRTAIVPAMVKGGLAEDDRAARWRHLADLYLVQQLHCYPGEYLGEPTPERIIETVDRYEEDLTDIARPHFPLRVVISVGDAIEVGPTRDRSEQGDPAMTELRRQMEELLESSKTHRKVSPTGADLS